MFLAVVSLSGSLILLAVLARTNLEQKSMFACIGYAVGVSVFMGAQLWGFVMSQTTYSEVVEEPKYKLLELEEAEWKK